MSFFPVPFYWLEYNAQAGAAAAFLDFEESLRMKTTYREHHEGRSRSP